MRDAPWMAERRAIAAAAPRPARPSPPANKGLSKRASRPKIECGGPGLDIIVGMVVHFFEEDKNVTMTQPRTFEASSGATR